MISQRLLQSASAGFCPSCFYGEGGGVTLRKAVTSLSRRHRERRTHKPSTLTFKRGESHRRVTSCDSSAFWTVGGSRTGHRGGQAKAPAWRVCTTTKEDTRGFTPSVFMFIVFDVDVVSALAPSQRRNQMLRSLVFSTRANFQHQPTGGFSKNAD